MFGLGSAYKRKNVHKLYGEGYGLLSSSPIGALTSMNLFREIQNYVYSGVDARMTDEAAAALLSEYRIHIGIVPNKNFKSAVDAYIEKQIDGIESYLQSIDKLGNDANENPKSLTDKQRETLRAGLLAAQPTLKLSAAAFDEQTLESPTMIHPEAMRNFAQQERALLLEETDSFDLFESVLSKQQIQTDLGIGDQPRNPSTACLANLTPDEFDRVKEILDQNPQKGRIFNSVNSANYSRFEFNDPQIAELKHALQAAETKIRKTITTEERRLQDTQDTDSKTKLESEIQALNKKADNLQDINQKIRKSKLGEAQFAAQKLLGEQLNDTISIIHAAAEIEQVRIKAAARLAVANPPKASFFTPEVEVIAKTQKRIHDIQKGLKEKNSALLKADGGLKTVTGLAIEVTETDEKHLSFKMQFPGRFLGAGFYTDSRNLVRSTMENLVEAVQATGADVIEFKIRDNDPEMAAHMGREAFLAARARGFAEADIEIKINGVLTKREDLFSKKEMVGDKEQKIPIPDISDQLAEEAAKHRKEQEPTRDIIADQQKQARKLLNEMRHNQGLLARKAPDVEPYIAPPPPPPKKPKDDTKPEIPSPP